MNATQHQELLEQFRTLGGSEKLAQNLTPFSLKNFAKLKYELSKLEGKGQNTEGNPPDAKSEPPTAIRQNKVFNDLIADYPVALHPVFRKRWEVWMEACSLKIQLNELGDKTQTAVSRQPTAEDFFAIQWKIYQCFQEFDKCQTILKHYREHKRVMPFELGIDFTKMSEMEVFKHRNNLRALITRRKQTIEKLENELPSAESQQLKAKQHTINLKKEQLQEKINELLECNKILNDGEI